jgi:hypothetical protein
MSSPKQIEESAQPESELKLFLVPIAVKIDARLEGEVKVLATDKSDALAKIDRRIDSGEINKLEHEISMSYDDLVHLDLFDCMIMEGTFLPIDGTNIQEVPDAVVEPCDALEEDVQTLLETIAWDNETKTQHKIFLAGLKAQNRTRYAIK